MDESDTENNSIVIKSTCSIKEIEKLPNKLNSSDDTKLISKDKNKFNAEVKTSLPTKKQRLKEYLRVKASTADNNIIFTHQSKCSSPVNLINFESKNNSIDKPVKVKSRWTRSSQMEMELVLENSASHLTENNIAQSSEETDNMAVTSEDHGSCNFNMASIEKINLAVQQLSNECCVIVHKYGGMKSEKKRGRPKKTAVKVEIKKPGTSGVSNKKKTKPVSDLKPQVEEVLKTVKRSRGRPRKNPVEPVIKTKQSPPSAVVTKKRKGKKPSLTNVTRGRPKSKKTNATSENEVISNISSDSGLSKSCDIDVTNNLLIFENSTTLNESEPIGKNLEFSDKIDHEVLSSQIPKEIIDILETCYDSSVQEDIGIDCSTSTISISLSNDENEKQNELIEFNELNMNTMPVRNRSKSFDMPSKKRNRRNSLSDNFVYSINNLEHETDAILKKNWKSLSYLEGGPNPLIERFERKELDKKFRSELKRSRSFPNCMFLDTVIWRYLVYQHSYDSDEKYVELSDTEMDLINELSWDGYNREYRSKSMPIESYEYKHEKKLEAHKSLDNLNDLCFTNNSPLKSFQIPLVINLMENTESNSLECEGTRRRSKRLNSKIKHNDMFEEGDLLESYKMTVNYLQIANEIHEESQKQLAEARKNDPELEKKLKTLNFTFITNNIYRPDRNKMGEYSPAEAQELRKLKHKSLNMDTYVLCECVYSKSDWINKKDGCGELCLNRMLNIECGMGCSLETFCTNKQFQNKQFKKTQLVKTANKGYGVFALEDIPSGAFIDEYVGEVIDQNEMIKRMKKKLYLNNNYMVQLKHDEVIDATRKGNITRFINHSCEPNCTAEKWSVLGESRMGFFSSTRIKKGEEITFDYSFQIFGDAAQQKCYCGTPKCRGYITKKSKTEEQSSSDESEDNEEESEVFTTKSGISEEKKKTIKIQKITNKDKKRLRELDRQLTDISNLKNKNRSDLESATLNLNKLMVHITDSMSRSHILKFIREHDMNCKRLFMNFNGLSIIHSWMTSCNNDKLKIEIIQMLSELPISNRNTITKSKVLDIVTEWANIPLNIKEAAENSEYPLSKSEEHWKKIDKLLPEENNFSSLIQVARVLWKKWIVLKMVFKIPKLERSKEVTIPKVVLSKSLILSQLKPKADQYHFEKPTISCQSFGINREEIKNKLKSAKNLQDQNITEKSINSMDTFSKIINRQNQIDNRDKNKAVLEWNKKHLDYSMLKANNKNNSLSLVKDLKRLDSSAKHGIISTFKPKNQLQEIPTIENSIPFNNVKWSNIVESTIPTVYTFTAGESEISMNIENTCKTASSEYYPIEEIITTNQTWSLPPPTIVELNDVKTLQNILKMAPPSFQDNTKGNLCDETQTDMVSCTSPRPIMNPENVFYDAQYPSIEEQLALMLIPLTATINNTTISLDLSDDNVKNKGSHQNTVTTIRPVNENIQTSFLKASKKSVNNSKKSLNANIAKKSSNKNMMMIQKRNNNSQIVSTSVLFKQAEMNKNLLFDGKLLDLIKSSKLTDPSPIKISLSYFKKKLSECNSQMENTKNNTLFNFIRNLKIVSNGFREQPSNIFKINNLKSKLKMQSKLKSKKNKNNVFKIHEEKKTDNMNTNSDSTSLNAHYKLGLCTEKLRTIPQNLNINKLINKQPIKMKTKNKFACKILNGLMKSNSSLPNSFILQLPANTKIITHDPRKELDLYHKLAPTVKHKLCAKLKRGNGENDTINVFKQKFSMKYDESLPKKSAVESCLLPKEKPDVVVDTEKNGKVHKILKRKMPLPPFHNLKKKKMIDSSVKTIPKFKIPIVPPNPTDDDIIFKKPMVPGLDKKKNYSRNSKITVNGYGQRPSTPSQGQGSSILIQGQGPSTSSLGQGPSTSNQGPSTLSQGQRPNMSSNITPRIPLLKSDENHCKQKPLMKCLPFNKVVDNNLKNEEVQNARNLAESLSMSYSNNVTLSSQPNSELIDPIVENFKTAIRSNATNGRTSLVDDPIVREYINCTQLDTIKSKRKFKLPESMMSLPVEVLQLIPDKPKAMRFVIDFYHSMATVIVKALDSYVKKSCKQGRIRNDEDFKYLAKKLNANILFKELQVKKVEDLKISDSVREKVEQYIKKYMLKYGKVFKRKTSDQS